MKSIGIMSLQPILRAARSRALLCTGSRRLGAPRQCTAHLVWRRNQHHWLSTSSKDGFSWEKSVGNAATLQEIGSDDDETGTTSAERDRMLREIRKSIHNNVERIVNEKPGVRKKWKRILHRRQKEQRRQSLSFSVTRDKTSGNAPQTMNQNCVSEADPWTANKSGDSVSEIWSGGTAHRAESNIQPVSAQTHFESAWGTSSRGSTESEEAFDAESNLIQAETRDENQSFLELLRQPIEEETVVTPEAVTDGSLATHSSLLLSLLNDDAAFADPAEETRGDNVKRNEDDGMNLSSGLSTTSESLKTQPTSLMDLLNDDNDAEPMSSFASEINEDLYSSQEDKLTDQDEHAGIQSASLFDLLSQPIEEEQSGDSKSFDFDEEVDATANVWSSKSPESDKTDENTRGGVAFVDEGLALLLALRGRDWSQMGEDEESEDESEHGVPETADIEEEIVIETDIEEEEIGIKAGYDMMEETGHDEDDEQVGDNGRLDEITGLLDEAGSGDMVLTTVDYNALLLHVVTSSLQTDDTIELMLKTYQQMSELGRSGVDCAPDATTFIILMVTLDRRANAPLSAADICRQMMDSGVELSSEAFVQGISCLNLRNGIRDTERLMNSVLDNETSQLVVPIWAWMSLLRMYKNENMQHEALDLVEKCINKVRIRTLLQETNSSLLLKTDVGINLITDE